MLPGVAKQRDETIACAIDHRRTVRKSVDGVDVASDVDEARNLVEAAERRLDIRERHQRADAGRLIAGLHRLLAPDLAGMRHLPVEDGDRAGAVEQIAG